MAKFIAAQIALRILAYQVCEIADDTRKVESWSCGYSAACLVPWCSLRVTTILRYLDAQGRPYRQTDACRIHARELRFGMKVIDRKRRSESESMKPRYTADYIALLGLWIVWVTFLIAARRHRVTD
jgi:hypothetical protein